MQAAIKPANFHLREVAAQLSPRDSDGERDDSLVQFPLGGHSAPLAPSTEALQQEVHDIQAAVLDVLQESSLDEKVEGLRVAVDHLNEGADSRVSRNGADSGTFQQLKHQVDQVQTEWQALAASLHGQRERLEALLSSFPSVVEIAAVRALGLRMNLLEHLVTGIVDERDGRSSRRLSRTQLGISVAGLGVTVVLWGAFYSMRFWGI
jgi:hypothetical protein